MALLQMYANNTYIFMSMKKQTQTNQFSSFLIANHEYGLENDSLTMYDLVRDFNIEDDLRRVLKDKKTKIIYKRLKSIDLSEREEEENEEDRPASTIVLEIGRSIIQNADASSFLVRVKLQ